MGIFGKKKEEDYEEEDGQLESKDGEGDRKLTRKINKDLEPRNKQSLAGFAGKKKRKEPPKPWGKKERMTVLTVLLVTILISGVLALTARGYNLPELNTFDLDHFSFGSLNIFKDETIIIRKSE